MVVCNHPPPPARVARRWEQMMTSMKSVRFLACATLTAGGLTGCPGPVEPGPADAFALDAFVIRADAGTDAAEPGVDAPGLDAPGVDAFAETTDAGPGTDAAADDAFVVGADAFAAWPTDPCAQITLIRAMAGGTLSTPRPVTGAVVSYVLASQPMGASDPVGVFVQCPGAEGPALFLAVDPTTLSPAPTVGDVVSFDVTSAVDVASGAGSTGDQHRVTGLSGYTRTATGMSLAPTDLSGIDLPAMIDAHESELVTITGTIAAAATPAGAGYTSFQITTTGFPTAGATLRARMPSAIAGGLTPSPVPGCTIALGPTPLWRFTTTAQPSAWQASEVTVDCPTPAPAAGEVFVTEVGYQFAGSDNDKEFVEIHNPSAAVTYDLGGCILSDSAGPMDADAVVLPAPTLVGPGDYLVVAGAMSEVAGDVVLPATLGFGGDDAVQLHCGATLIDAVAWTTSGIGGADDVSAQLDLAQVTAAGATNNDAAASWCSTPTGSIYGATMRRGTPGAANVACVAPPACPAATHLVLNEIDYDQSGSDTAEFVEIFNPTAAAIDLTGHFLVAVNGTAGGPEYGRVALTGSIAPGGFVLVTASGSTVAGATLSLPVAMQNGAPDGFVLLGPAGVVDAAICEGTMGTITLMGGAATSLAESGSIGTDGGDGGLSRRPDGCDRDMPTMDWAAAPVTPGAANM